MWFHQLMYVWNEISFFKTAPFEQINIKYNLLLHFKIDNSFVRNWYTKHKSICLYISSLMLFFPFARHTTSDLIIKTLSLFLKPYQGSKCQRRKCTLNRDQLMAQNRAYISLYTPPLLSTSKLNLYTGFSIGNLTLRFQNTRDRCSLWLVISPSIAVPCPARSHFHLYLKAESNCHILL